MKLLHLHIPNQNNHHCDDQRSRSILLLVLCCPSNVGKLQKYNTWIKPPSHRRYIFPCLFPISEDLIYMSSCVRFPHRRELAPRKYLASLVFFAKFENWTSSVGGLPLFGHCSICAMISCGLVLLCGKSHVEYTLITVMGWVVLYYLIVK